MEYYNSLLQGDQGALKRALYKSMGFTDEVLSKPLVAVVNSYTNTTPGHFNLNILSERVQKGIEASGGTAMTFFNHCTLRRYCRGTYRYEILPAVKRCYCRLG